MMRVLLAASLLTLAACSDAPDGVDSSGKSDVSLADVPAAALAVAETTVPGMSVTEAEAETRDGRDYLELGGTRPDGAEVELDMIRDGETWRVMEIQRDLPYADVPGTVVAALPAELRADPADRVIESVQTEGGTVWEFFYGEGDERVKHEVLVKDGRTEYLTEEWAH